MSYTFTEGVLMGKHLTFEQLCQLAGLQYPSGGGRLAVMGEIAMLRS